MEAVNSLARVLVMSTVAEGIETGGQEELLRILGSDLGQGYYFAGPRPASEASAMLPSHPDRPG